LTDTIKNKGKINKFVVLTFDDGFKNVVENAYPIMQEYGAKGCFFLVSDLIGTDQLLWTDFVETAIRNVHADDIFFTFKGDEIRYKIGDKRSSEHAMKDIKAKLRTLPDKERIVHLRQFESYELKNIPKEFHMASWQEIKALDPDIFEIGSHTKMHPDCANLTSEEELKNEIHDSKIDIEKEIGRQIKHFCYPASSRNDTVTRFVKEYGYESAVTLRIGLNDINSDLYRLKRIESREEPLLFRASISGSLALIRRIRDLMP
jgi:peptidoglycan/xylan/chitin deacetylase (PgdA/CDA1 family)